MEQSEAGEAEYRPDSQSQTSRRQVINRILSVLILMF
jgi:hypothetical protein